MDPDVRRRAREREDSIKFYEMSLAASEARGEARGQVKILLKQLQLRFGSIPERARTRVEAAVPEQVEVWAERVLTAQTDYDALAPLSELRG